MSKTFKVLFVYPGLYMQTALNLGLASLAARLKELGVETELFDAVLYQLDGEIDENEERASKHRSVKQLDYASVGLKRKETGMVEDFLAKLDAFQPDLVALTAVESNFERGLELMRAVKAHGDTPVIAGGVFPTLAPEIALADDAIDMICIGEGEETLAEVCRRLEAGEACAGVRGTWVKTKDGVVKTPPRELKSLESMPDPDFSMFPSYLFHKPMQGNLFRTLPVELSRGCPFQCTYCAEPAIRRLYKSCGGGAYFRKLGIGRVMDHIRENVEKHGIEFIYFTSETFLAMSDEDFREFTAQYAEIRLPFWIQTRPETISAERIAKLKEIGLFWLTMGIEHGNPEFRERMLKRRMSNDLIKTSMRILNDLDQGASINSILGFPFETRELAYETLALNRELFKINPKVRCNISIFTPFRGCELYDLSVQNNLFEPVPYLSDTNITSVGFLKNNTLPPDQLMGLYRTFPLHVYLPDEHLPRIGLAETLTPEGDRAYEELNALLGEYLQ